MKKAKNSRLFLSFLRLGLTAFGGPAMIAQVKELSVNRNRWLDGETFKHGRKPERELFSLALLMVKFDILSIVLTGTLISIFLF